MKSPKKSETLEVRLSHPDKVALQDKAAREGRTVSAVVRGLISSYLSQGEPRSKSSRLTELLMTLKSRPKTVLATLACLPALMLPIFMATPATAADIALTFGGEFIKPEMFDGVEGKRVKRFSTEIEMDLDQLISMRLPSLPSQGDSSSLFMMAKISEAYETVTIEITICEIEGDIAARPNVIELTHIDGCQYEHILANPKLTTKYGEKVEFSMGDETGQTISLTASPKPL